MKVLVTGCGSTGPWMCQIVSGNAAGKVRDIFEKKLKLTADCIDKTVACHKLWIIGGIPLKVRVYCLIYNPWNHL